MRAFTALVAGACLALGGCVTEVDPNERDEDFAKHSAADVKKRFKEVTGAQLSSGTVINPVLETLRVESDPDARGTYDRYGSVTVDVTGNEDARDRATERSTNQIETFDNVVVRANGTDERSRAAFRRMVGVMSSLGKPAGAAKVADEDVPCAKAGIDPEGGDGKEGTCAAPDGRAVEVVNADGTLELPDQTISGLRVATGTTLTERAFGSTDRETSQGRYVVVSFEVENTGARPLSSLRPGLVVDGNQYSDDLRGTIRVRDTDAFPIQPGGRARARAVFDVPGSPGREVLAEGALELPAGEFGYASVESSVRTGRIRLEGARPLGRRFGGVRLSD